MPESIKDNNFKHISIDDTLVLQEVKENELGILIDLVDINRDYLAKFLPWANNTSETSYLDFIKSIHEKRLDGSGYGFGIYHRENLVGHTSLMHLKDEKVPEIGYWVAESRSGLGIATSSAKMLTKLALDTLELDEVIIKARTDNIGSNSIPHKLGYELFEKSKDDDGSNINIWRKIR